MKTRFGRFAVGLVLLLSTGYAVTGPRGIQVMDVFITLLLFFWVGLPLLFLGAIVWELTRSWLASLRRPAPVIRVPDIDLMT